MRASDSIESLTPTVELLHPVKDLITTLKEFVRCFMIYPIVKHKSIKNSASSQLLVNLLLVSEPTRYRLGQQPSVLNLIITSDKTSLTNLKFSDPIGYSDHLVLNIDF
ncbi:hypothetical protein BDFB_007687 [Asbolus verrucosus]|uniref:Uncharacterized protein n=1 Tax=Asbolus verrucosus TaxID=1661398 RepID=A0A482VG63_ASBVE|nr:hypothetical protein BDFB_007687 [Asbolus verrucosus]